MQIVYFAFRILFLFFKILALILVIAWGFFFIQWLYRNTALWVEFIIAHSEYYWQRRWLSAHRKAQKIEYKNIDTYNPIRGWALMPDLKGKTFKASVVSSNSEGIRGAEELSGDKENILFMGDSFCFGEDVNDDQTIPHFFQRKTGSFQSINLGVHGYGIDQQYLYFKEAGARYKPKITCFIISFDDFNRNFLKFRDYAKPMFRFKKSNISLTNYPVPDPEYYLKEQQIVPLLILFFDFFKQVLLYYGIIGKKRRLELCAYLLRQIKLHTEALGSRLFFVYVPNTRGLFYKNFVNGFFIDAFKREGIGCLDLGACFTRQALLGITDCSTGHFTAKGNELVAQKLAELLKTEWPEGRVYQQ